MSAGEVPALVVSAVRALGQISRVASLTSSLALNSAFKSLCTACSVYPGDTTGRLYSDWQNIYKNPVKTPTIANLTWYNVFGNHDVSSQLIPVALLDL